MTRFGKTLQQALLLSILVVPNAFRGVKLWLLCAAAVTMLFSRESRFVYDRGFAKCVGIFVLGMSLFCAYGLMEAPVEAAPYILLAFVVGPVVWTLFLAEYIRSHGLMSLLRTIILGSALASILIIVNFVFFDQLPAALKEALIVTPNISLREGVAGSRFHAISTLVFAVPACFFALDKNHPFLNVTRGSLRDLASWGLVAAFSGASILSGRSGLLVIFAASVVLGLTRTTKGRVTILCAGLVTYLLLPSIGVDLWATANEQAARVASYGGEERIAQREALLDGFAESPLVGHGLGTVASLKRSEENPWRYELFFHGLLFHCGIVGVAIYFLPIVMSLFVTWKRLALAPHVRKFIVYGCLGVLAASFTNPYIEGLESQWMLTLPWAVALLNEAGLRLWVPQAAGEPSNPEGWWAERSV